jgi:hypothetical protein
LFSAGVLLADDAALVRGAGRGSFLANRTSLLPPAAGSHWLID